MMQQQFLSLQHCKKNYLQLITSVISSLILIHIHSLSKYAIAAHRNSISGFIHIHTLKKKKKKGGPKRVESIKKRNKYDKSIQVDTLSSCEQRRADG